MSRFPLQLSRNDVPGALRWVEDNFRAFGAAPREDAMAILYQLQDDPSELRDKLVEVFERHAPQPEELVVDPSPAEG